MVVRFPFCSRPWALPVVSALYRPEEVHKKERRRHTTPIQLAQGLMSILLHSFPDKKFVLLGDGGYASHDLARFCHRHRERLALVIYTTHEGFTPEQVVTVYTLRWNLEVAFQELRAHLGFETPRQRVEKSVLRTAPCLLGLFSVISLIYHEHLKRHNVVTCDRPCYTKSEPTFGDAIATVRRLC